MKKKKKKITGEGSRLRSMRGGPHVKFVILHPKVKGLRRKRGEALREPFL